MKKSVIILVLILTYGQAMAESVKIEPILTTNQSWNGASLPGFNSGKSELRVLRFKIAPGAKTPIHAHPLNGAGYLISGELTMYATEDPHGDFSNRKQVKKIILLPGKAWAETVNTWHYGENKGKNEAEFILIFAGQEGTPLTLTLGTFIQ